MKERIDGRGVGERCAGRWKSYSRFCRPDAPKPITPIMFHILNAAGVSEAGVLVCVKCEASGGWMESMLSGPGADTVRRAAQELHGGGLVACEPIPGHGECLRVRITDAGRSLLGEMAP
jgi:hypothetical protein